MTITTIASVVAVALTSLVPASCHKTTAATGAPAIVTAGDNRLNSTNCFLGEVNLTNHAETCIQISPGKQCFFTTKMLDRRNAQITLALECKETNSKTGNLSVTQIVTKSDKPFEIALGNCSLSFTPHISE